MCKKRINFNVSEEKFREIENMVEKTELGTKAGLFNEAYTFYKWAYNEIALGREICSKDEALGTNKTIEMTGWQSASREGTKDSATMRLAKIAGTLINQGEWAQFAEKIVEASPDGYKDEEIKEIKEALDKFRAEIMLEEGDT